MPSFLPVIGKAVTAAIASKAVSGASEKDDSKELSRMGQMGARLQQSADAAAQNAAAATRAIPQAPPEPSWDGVISALRAPVGGKE